MEECAEKAKITPPKLGRNFAFGKWKLLVTIALMAQLMAFFSPWLWQKYAFLIDYIRPDYPIVPIDSLPREAWFWPFMTIVKTIRGEWKILLFTNYWSNSNMMGSRWFLLSMFQIFTIVAALFILRKGGSKKRIASVTLFLLSLGAPILCISQAVTQTFPGYTQSEFFVGFWLAVFLSLLFIISVRFG
jgi:hypothetical protein